jgi:hypothetical protein
VPGGHQGRARPDQADGERSDRAGPEAVGVQHLGGPAVQGVPQGGGGGEVVGGAQVVAERQDDAVGVDVEQVREGGEHGARTRQADVDAAREQALHQTADVGTDRLGRGREDEDDAVGRGGKPARRHSRDLRRAPPVAGGAGWPARPGVVRGRG